ncbi:MAG: NUDIX domain-containing protein [Bacteroidales bacterium]|jgi:8-oxo-dGTP pyrophosphatase MutT (NUDIX family)|nr:NUDIX domain-containing protein [Bacteroidales bacterium]
MERKIYYNSNCIYLSDSKNTFFSHTIYECENKTDVQTVLQNLQTRPQFKIVLYNPDFKKLFSWFAAEFVYIEAAGGLVKNQYDEYLFIHRNGYLDLPKGKFEKDETADQTALREVQEETGLHTLYIEKFLCSTWHTYPYKGNMALKQTYWYAMSAPKEQQLTPQTEEGISAIEWLSKHEITTTTQAMYASVKDVVLHI